MFNRKLNMINSRTINRAAQGHMEFGAKPVQ